MGLFGNQRPAWATPGYGDGTQQGQVGGVPQYGALDTSVPVDPYEGQRPEKPGFFGKGGLGGKLLMGGIGGALDGVARWGGAEPGYANGLASQREFEQEIVKAKLLAKLRDGGSEIITLPNGGVARVDKETGQIEVIREPEPEDRRTSDERNFEYRKGLPEAERGDFDRMRPGYAFTEEGIAALARQTQERAKAQAQYRAPPRGGPGGGGVTPTARAKYIAEAQSAIAAGADPAKVRARLTQMGIN